MALLHSSLALISLLGNIWVISVVLSLMHKHNNVRPYKQHVKGTIENSIILHLLIWSVISLIFVLPISFVVIDIFHNEWSFDIILCKLMFLCKAFNKSLSPLPLAVLNVDCCITFCLTMLLSLTSQICIFYPTSMLHYFPYFHRSGSVL